MARNRNSSPHNLRIHCGCIPFGIPMIRIAAWAESFLRHEGADYRCPNCGKGRRALLVTSLLFPSRIRFRRI